MKTYLTKILSFLTLLALVVPLTSSASDTLPLVRVFYHPDDSVSVLYVMTRSCKGEETQKECVDRIAGSTPQANLPFDDMDASKLPKDRANRDKWRGHKGGAVTVDTTLITKTEKLKEYEGLLDQELNKDTPNGDEVARLQGLITKVKKIDTKIIEATDIAKLDNQKGFFSRAFSALGDITSSVFASIKDSVLSLASVITRSLKIGTPEAPSGITVFDQKTGEPRCIIVKDNILQTTQGECTAGSLLASTTEPITTENPNQTAPLSPTATSSNAGESIEQATSTPSGVSGAATSSDEIASSTPATTDSTSQQNVVAPQETVSNPPLEITDTPPSLEPLAPSEAPAPAPAPAPVPPQNPDASSGQ